MPDDKTRSKRGGYRPGAGRPPGVPTPAHIRKRAVALGDQALGVVAALMEGADSEAVRLDAAKALLNLGFGQADGRPFNPTEEKSK
jgi:hypothetical protein